MNNPVVVLTVISYSRGCSSRAITVRVAIGEILYEYTFFILNRAFPSPPKKSVGGGGGGVTLDIRFVKY